MKIKELIEELQKFNPDGTVEVEVEVMVGFSKKTETATAIAVEDSGCAMINAVIVAR